MKMHIMLVSDKKYGDKLKKTLQSIGSIDIAISKKDFYRLFEPHKYDIILIQLNIPKKNDGLELITYTFEEDPAVPIITLVESKNIKQKEIEDAGSHIVFNIKRNIDEIKIIIKNIINEIKYKIKLQSSQQENSKIIGEHPLIKEAIKNAYLVAKDGQASVLITGETGTGKDLFARTIHKNGIRSEESFVPVAIPTLNKETLVSELFGHERGAFTGANTRHIGYIEQAHRGVLFLDEIGDLSPDAQLKLLRFLDSKKFRRMGGQRDISVDIQIITATNKNFQELIENNQFRSDLYYRLHSFEIHIPPLRKRREDIPLLVNYFLYQLFNANRTTANKISDTAMEILIGHHWPGNVRELKQVIEFASLKAKLLGQSKIVKGLLPEEIIKETSIFTLNPKKTNVSIKEQTHIEDKNLKIDEILAIEELKHIEKTLKECYWKKIEASKKLGYKNRFVMRRRILRHFNKYPHLKDKFSDLNKIFN